MSRRRSRCSVEEQISKTEPFSPMKRAYAPYDAFTTADEDRVDELSLRLLADVGLHFHSEETFPILENNGVFMFFLADHFSHAHYYGMRKKSASCDMIFHVLRGIYENFFCHYRTYHYGPCKPNELGIPNNTLSECDAPRSMLWRAIRFNGTLCQQCPN